MGARDWISRGWRVFTGQPLLLVAGGLAVMAMELVVETVARGGGLIALPGTPEADAAPGFPVLALYYLLSWAVLPLFYVGYQYLALRAVRGEDPSLGDILTPFRHPVSVLGAYWLATLIAVAGFLLLIVPGVVWGIKYVFSALAAVDKGLSALDALGESGDLTAGHKWPLFRLGLLAFLSYSLLGGLGYLALLKGHLPWGAWLLISSGAQIATMPWLTTALAAAYRDLDEARRAVTSPA